MNLGGVRLAGLSGIFKAYSYRRGHYERAPYSPDDLRSVYHVRSFEEFQLRQASNSSNCSSFSRNTLRLPCLRCFV